MLEYNEKINSLVFKRYNMFAALKQSDYLTLVDKRGFPITITINGEKHFFTFSKHHKSINICDNKGGLSFYEKLYIANVLKPKVRWVNLSLWKFRLALKRYVAVEPRNLHIKATPSNVTFKISGVQNR